MTIINKGTKGVCRFPISGFSELQEGDGVAIIGLNASGKTILMFDIAAELLVAGNKIGIIADELDGVTVFEKITISLRERLLFEGVMDEIEALESMKHRVVIFEGFKSFEEAYRSGNIEELDAILCDTFLFGSYTNDSRLEHLQNELAVLDEAREKNGIVYAYVLSGNRPTADKALEVIALPTSFDRIFYTSKVLGKLRVEEIDREGKLVASTDEDAILSATIGGGMSWGNCRVIAFPKELR